MGKNDRSDIDSGTVHFRPSPPPGPFPFNVEFKHLTCFHIEADKKVLSEKDLTDEKLS